jgi:uncharacterized protein YkwD
MLAAFELGRAPLGEAVRQWKWSRHLPLYAAGLFAGAGIGLGIASFNAPSGSFEAEQPLTRPIVLQVEPPAAIPAIPAGVPIRGIPVLATGVGDDVDATPIVDGPPAGLLLPGDPYLITLRPAEPVAPEAPIVAEAPVAPSQPAPAASLPQVQPAPPAAEPAPAQPDPAPAQPDPAPAQPAAAPEKPNFYVPDVSQAGLNGLEQRFLAAANAERVAAGMAPLTLEHGLTIIARTRSQQLVDQDYFGHRDPYGYSMYVELLALRGYTSYAWAGENLAMNNFAEAESPERAVVALMKSPTHKRNILATEFTRIGVGLATTDDGRKYYTMIFLS